MRARYLVGSILLVLILAGCTQSNTGEVSITCQAYCEELPHTQCIGYWDTSGVYPDCACAWICSGGGSDVVAQGACSPDWQCSDWGICQSTGVQTRVCTDLNACAGEPDKPVEQQDCDYTTICEVVSNEDLRTTCDVLTTQDVSNCDEDDYENCVYNLAKFTLNKSLCEEINSSFIRNSCKAILNYDYSYCDILEPSVRDACYGTLNVYLSNRAEVERDYYYCGLIEDESFNETCRKKLDLIEDKNYLSNVSVCEKFDFDYNETVINGTYYEIFSCFAYHAVNDAVNPCSELSTVENLTDVFGDECEALFNDDLSYCYDLNGTERDRCYAHFAYARNDSLLCRDAADRDECLFIAGKYFDLIDFCQEISSTTKHNSCIYTVATHCLPYDWRECESEYCRLIEDNDDLRDVCIYNVIKYDQEHTFTYKRYI